MKISQKLTLGFISIALLIAVVGYISVNASQKALQRNIGQTSTSFAATILDQIDKSIYNRIETFQEYCKDSLIQQVILESNNQFEKLDNRQSYINQQDTEWTSVSKETATPFMEELIENTLSEELRKRIDFYEKKYGYKVFGEIFVTNKYGANAAQSGKTSDYYQADEQWWQDTKKTGLYVGDVEYDKSANVYSTDICIRINDLNGNFAGVIKAVLNIEETINFIKKAEATAEEVTSRKFKLLHKDRKVIYATGGNEFLEPLPEELLLLLRDHYDVEYGRDGYFIGAGDKAEETKLYAYTHSEGYKDFKGLGWIILVEHETKEIFASVAKLKNRILAASIAITALAIIIGLIISKSISHPISKLSIAVAKVGKGKLNTRLEIKSKDEIGSLAHSFNSMAENLQSTTTSIDNLNTANQQLQASQQQLEATNEKLSSSNQQLQEFIYVASHDLREPVRKISSFGQLLTKALAGKLNDDEQENFDYMIDGANRMQQMIEALLAYSRVTTKAYEYEEIDLNEIIEQIRCFELAVKLEETSGCISVPEPLPIVKGDTAQIRQLLQNLIGNALKYHKKEEVPEITIRAHSQANGTVRIEVEDNGIGIKTEQCENVFTMFKRLHSRQEYDGTGIGLAVCKRIVERHKGEIGVSSTYGQGSTFWFQLPLSQTSDKKQMELILSCET